MSAESTTAVDIIDVYADTVPGPRQRLRGQQPAVHARPSRDFRTPPMATPAILRPSTWPATAAGRHEILERAEDLERAHGKELRRRVAGVRLLLDWLDTFPGVTWQQRWLASGADHAGESWADAVSVPGLLAGVDGRAQLTGGAGRMVLLGALRPAYGWLYRLRSGPVLERFRTLHDPAGFAALEPICDGTSGFTVLDRRSAYHQLTRILMHNGRRLADVTLDDCIEAYRAQAGYSARQHSHWYLLMRQAGFLPSEAPPTIRAASRRGQLSVEELVDGYDVACPAVRSLLVDYLHERQAAMDYSSLRQLATKLVLLFWRDLELHEPGITSLRLADDVARRWKERLRHVRYGNHRVGQLREDPNTILMAVRSFYADLAAWALEDPTRWAVWAAPNPVTSRDLLGQNKQKKRATARMHQRTRELAPVLPALVRAVDRRRVHAGRLLAAAQQTAPSGEFVLDGERLQRLSLGTDPARGGTGRPGVVYTAPPGGGARRNLTLEEDDAFWAWAIVEVLRHTGVRIEEMLELTHRSFVAYKLPTSGEVIPLLQVTPSKTDRERLLVVSPDLAEVLSAVISRIRAGGEHVPLVSRYDQAERLHSPFLPFLFQRRWGLRQQALTPLRVKVLLDRSVDFADVAAADGRPLRFTPHDFRRIFATEAVATGLPVHIAARLLGHESLATTQAYVAVYDQDVIDHHRAFIARRRELRPSEEYREPTAAEWEEFLGHFERRKVELGVCGRAYGTPCQHEHACLRCPMLRPDPGQHDRLVEIIDNLNARVAEAHERGWLGEVEGLEASLSGARQKLAAMGRGAGLAESPVLLRAGTPRPSEGRGSIDAWSPSSSS
jgi:integrase